MEVRVFGMRETSESGIAGNSPGCDGALLVRHARLQPGAHTHRYMLRPTAKRRGNFHRYILFIDQALAPVVRVAAASKGLSLHRS